MDDSQLSVRVEAERKAVATENINIAISAENLKSLSLALNSQINEQTLRGFSKNALFAFI